MFLSELCTLDAIFDFKFDNCPLRLVGDITLDFELENACGILAVLAFSNIFRLEMNSALVLLPVQPPPSSPSFLLRSPPPIPSHQISDVINERFVSLAFFLPLRVS